MQTPDARIEPAENRMAAQCLRGPGGRTQARFIPKPDCVRVVVLCEGGDHIDRDMSRADARELWTRLVAKKWQRIEERDAYALAALRTLIETDTERR